MRLFTMESESMNVPEAQFEMDREEILEVLRCLISRAESGVVKECLRDAVDDISFLTSTTLEVSEDEALTVRTDIDD